MSSPKLCECGCGQARTNCYVHVFSFRLGQRSVEAVIQHPLHEVGRRPRRARIAAWCSARRRGCVHRRGDLSHC